ncbi:hypothetical protein NEMBOFW57_009560 [Staphylotrichum longicolle]|uniref:Uncharacterized protein n=1 Tax=Staphylotrichum longicolle TaxID=669026 RepID=A0AAD4EPN6_9PEZI|nr:hypothetical protein NEMBOFW57_009560 [Staphylotrichum longicolle]
MALDLDEKAHLLPELDEVLSSTGESSATLDEDDDYRPSRNHSTHTQHSSHRRVLPARFPSISSIAPTTYTAHPLLSWHDLAGQAQPLQLPATQKTVLESWTITYHHPRPRRTATTTTTTTCVRLFGLTLFRRVRREDDAEAGSVLSVVPNTHFSQAELAATVALHEAAVVSAVVDAGRWDGVKKKKRGLNLGAVYAADVEGRIRALDWKVQDEVYELLSDRVQSSSNAFRRREWRVVVLAAIPGGELTDAPRGPVSSAKETGKRRWFGLANGGRWLWRRVTAAKRKGDAEMPVTEYRLILRGTETKTSEQGWGYYNRYSRPWGVADDKEIGEKRRWSSLTGRSEKYVDF